MKKLIYVPIIHTADTDLGSLAPDVEEKASQLLGERWQRHKKTLNEYWQGIENYFETMNLMGVKIFQDALPAGGNEAEIIIDKLAETGSPNYRLLKKFVGQGAILQKTEDFGLLKQEYQLTKELLLHRSLFWLIFTFLNYKFKKERLLETRDRYIAAQINQNLNEAETGVCFLGAYHQVLPKLSKAINVIQVKRPGKLRDYYRKLMGNTETKQVNHLADYLKQPVKRGVLGKL